MKLKSLLLTFIAVLAVTATAGGKKIQGVPYQTFAKSHGLPVKPLFDIPDTGTQLPYDGEFTFDMIENWTGEGENRAALVIQWNDPDGRDAAALVFGYRWDGFATGYDMFRDVVLNNPQLFGLIQRTNVGCDISPIAPDGYTVDGIGWDDDESGDPGMWDSANNEYYYPEGGLQYHPRGGSGIDGSYPDYDYDNWKAADENDLWQAGWYVGYWSYWVKNSETEQFGYSGWGVACRELVDGCWDGWNYCPDMMPVDWKEFMPAPALLPDDADTEFKIDGLCYRLKNYKNATVTLSAPFDGSAYTNADLLPLSRSAGTIHSTFNYKGTAYTVVGIGKEAMVGAEITNLTIPSTVTAIEANAFSGSTVQSVTLPEKLAVLGESAFAGCINLSSIELPATITDIPANAFAYSGLKGNLVIPPSVINIMTSAFEGCETLDGVEIPSGVRMLMSKAFAGCTSLKDVKAYATEPLAIGDDVFDQSIYGTATLHCPKGFGSAYNEAEGWKNFTGVVGDFLIPVNMGDRFVYQKMPYQITSLADGSMTVRAKFHNFDGKHRDTAVEMANARFEGDVTIPSEVVYMDKTFRVTEISDSAFFRAKKLTSVKMPADIKGFGKSMFEGCEKLVSANIPDNVTEISAGCFKSCAALESITLPEGVTKIGNEAFYYCSSLEEIKLPAALTSIGARVFYQCAKLAEINLPAGITEIPDFAFGNCSSLTKMEFGDQITKIGSNALSNCVKLESVKLPTGITAIPASMFNTCRALAEINIPSTVTEIGSSAFNSCSALNIAIPSQIAKIGSSAFNGCTALTEVTVPAAIKKIESGTFQNCSNLTAVILPEGITEIAGNAFRECTKLASITIDGKQSDRAVSLPDALSGLGSYAFYNCKAVTDIEIPSKIKTLGTSAFQGSGLKSVTLNDGLQTISGNCFNGTQLSYCEIPAGVKSIQANAFLNCPSDFKLYVCDPDKVTSVASYSFRLTSKSPYTYADIVVPAGKASALSGKNYWKSSKITEPALTGVSYSVDAPVVSDNNVTLTAALAPAVDAALPSRFAEAAAEAIAPLLKAKVVYSPKGSADVTLEADAIVADGKATAELANLSKGAWEYHFVTTYGDSQPFSSTPGSFLIETSGISDIIADCDAAGCDATVYDLNGRRVNTASLPAGVYIRVTGNGKKVEKIIVK